MSNKDLEQQYHASRATSGLAPMSGGLNRRRSTAQVAPELTERRMTPVGGQPPPPSDRRSSQERPRSKFSVDCLENKFFKHLFAIFLIDVLVVAFFTTHERVDTIWVTMISGTTMDNHVESSLSSFKRELDLIHFWHVTSERVRVLYYLIESNDSSQTFKLFSMNHTSLFQMSFF